MYSPGLLSAADATQVASNDAYVLRADGTVWAWGDNDLGALGNDSVSDYTTVPVRVNGLTGVSAIAGTAGGGYALVP